MTWTQAMTKAMHILCQSRRLSEKGFSAYEVRKFLARIIYDLSKKERDMKRKTSRWDKPKGRPKK